MGTRVPDVSLDTSRAQVALGADERDTPGPDRGLGAIKSVGDRVEVVLSVHTFNGRGKETRQHHRTGSTCETRSTSVTLGTGSPGITLRTSGTGDPDSTGIPLGSGRTGGAGVTLGTCRTGSA